VIAHLMIVKVWLKSFAKTAFVPYIFTFGQFPLSNDMGLLEYIPNSQTIRTFDNNDRWKELKDYSVEDRDKFVLSCIGGIERIFFSFSSDFSVHVFFFLQFLP
jgi:hypothetical protein